MLLSTWITGATNTWPIITDRNTTPLLWFCRFLQFCGAITWTLFLSFGITDQLCSIYPPRPCNREVTELRTAYPHHGNLTPPRISPSRFREYHCHPDCHRLHEKLSHGLWRDSRSASHISEGSPRTSQVAITRTDVSVLAYSVFKVHEGISKRSIYLYK